MRKIVLGLGMLVCLGTGPAAEVLTVDQAVELARTHNLSLQTEDSKVRSKQRDRDLSWNRFIPTVVTSAALARTNQVSAVKGLAAVPGGPNQATAAALAAQGIYDWVAPYSVTPDAWNLALNFSAQLALSPALFSGIQQTVIDYDNAVLSRQAAEKKLDRDVRKTFYQLLAAQEALKLTERQVGNAEQRYLQAQNSFKSGLTSKLQVLQAQVAWENRKPALEDQRLGLKQGLLAFKFLLGLDFNRDLTLDGLILPAPLPADVTAEGLIGQSLDRRWDVLSLQGAIRSLNNVVRIQDDLLLPQLIFSWTADPLVNKPFDPDSYNETTTNQPWLQRSGSLAIMLRLGLDSLLPFSTAATTTASFRDQAEQAALGLAQTKRAGEMEIEILVEKIRKSETTLKALELNQSLAAEAYSQTEAAYKAGNQSLVEVQEAEVQLQAAQLLILNEKLNAVSNGLDLEYATGQVWSPIHK